MGRAVIVTAVTAAGSAVLIRQQMAFLRKKGFTNIVCSSPGPQMDALVEQEMPIYFPIEMAREARPWRDLISLIGIIKVLWRTRPDIVNAGTPKAGFLFVLAAWLLRVRHRIYHVRGLRHESLSGFARTLQKRIEWVTGRMATHVICLTPSVRDVAVAEGLFEPGKCLVLGPGSSGIELDRYDPTLFSWLI